MKVDGWKSGCEIWSMTWKLTNKASVISGILRRTKGANMWTIDLQVRCKKVIWAFASSFGRPGLGAPVFWLTVVPRMRWRTASWIKVGAGLEPVGGGNEKIESKVLGKGVLARTSIASREIKTHRYRLAFSKSRAERKESEWELLLR